MNDEFLNKAKELTVEHYPDHSIDPDDVYIVWFSKTLRNWKALTATNRSDRLYFEITHNGEKGETYIDMYKKQKNVSVSDDGKVLTQDDYI